MTYDLTTIGEGQIRLTCERGDRLATARSLRMTAPAPRRMSQGYAMR